MNTKDYIETEPTWASWTFAELLSIDTETTGLSPHHDRIVQIGAVQCRLGGERVVAIDQLVHPGRLIPPRVSAINGITNADVAKAPSMSQQLLCDLGLREEPFGKPVRIWVGNNADFDHAMLVSNVARWQGVSWFRPTWLDVKVLLKAVDGAGRFAPGYRMENMLPRFGLEYRGRAHSAVVDAHANLDLLEAMVRQYPKQLPSPAAALALQAHHLDNA